MSLIPISPQTSLGLNYAVFFALTFAHRDGCAAILRRADDIVRLTGLVLTLTHAAGVIPAELSPISPLCLSPNASALQATRCAPVELPLREAPEPLRPTKARCSTHQSSPHAAAIAGTGAMLLSGQQSTSWKSALACRTRSHTPLTKLEAVEQVFGTSDPDEGARAAALIEQAITHNAH